MELAISLFLVIFFTLLSGYVDAQGFLHAANIWDKSKFVPEEALKSALGFAFGIAAYWLALKYLAEIKTVSVEAQTLGWFVVTIVGIAVISGKFMRWQLIEQMVAIIVFVGIAWLLVKTH